MTAKLCPAHLANNDRSTWGTTRVCNSPAKTEAGYCLRHDPALVAAKAQAKADKEAPLRLAQRNLDRARLDLAGYRQAFDRGLMMARAHELTEDAALFLDDLRGLRSRLVAVSDAEAVYAAAKGVR